MMNVVTLSNIKKINNINDDQKFLVHTRLMRLKSENQLKTLRGQNSKKKNRSLSWCV